MLPPATQRLFNRLGVFAASLTLHAAEAVCTDEGILPARRTRPRHDTRRPLVARARQGAGTCDALPVAGDPPVVRDRAACRRARRQFDTASPRRVHPSAGRRSRSTSARARRGGLAGSDRGGRAERARRPFVGRRTRSDAGAAHGRCPVAVLGHALERASRDRLPRWRARRATWMLPTICGGMRSRCWPTSPATRATPAGRSRWRPTPSPSSGTLATSADWGSRSLALGSALGNQGSLDGADRALDEGLEIARRRDDPVLEARVPQPGVLRRLSPRRSRPCGRAESG